MHTAWIVLQMWKPFTEWKMLLDNPEHRVPGLLSPRAAVYLRYLTFSQSENCKPGDCTPCNSLHPSPGFKKMCCHNPSGSQGWGRRGQFKVWLYLCNEKYIFRVASVWRGIQHTSVRYGVIPGHFVVLRVCLISQLNLPNYT